MLSIIGCKGYKGEPISPTLHDREASKFSTLKIRKVDASSTLRFRASQVCRAFALTVSAKKTDTICMPPPRTPWTMVRVEAAGQIYRQVQSVTYLRGAVTEAPDMSVEIVRRTRTCWMRIRGYLRELYDQPKVALSLKTRMVKAEAIEALLYGCSTWTLRQEHYAKLRTVHHRVLLCIIGAKRKRPEHRMTLYNRALEITRCESIETTLRTRKR